MKQFIITYESVEYFDYKVNANNEVEAKKIVEKNIESLNGEFKTRYGSFELIDCQ